MPSIDIDATAESASDTDRDAARAAVVIGGAPEGQDARVIADLAGRLGDRPILHIALDDARAARLAALLRFFAPHLATLVLPAWDCLPYDRVSPNPQVVSRRLDTLGRLADAQAAGPPDGQGRVVITTVNAVLQRVPPVDALQGAALQLAVGGRIGLATLVGYLVQQGYGRAQAVREPGEFAQRGGLVDLWPPGRDEPVRVDLFGDEIEELRSFDGMTQRTTGSLDRLALRPTSEFRLDEAAIARFRSGYREAFGAVAGADPLYEAVSEGRRFPGMEHWLPLFHERLDTIPDYLPDAALTLDHQTSEAVASRLQQIGEFYQARADLMAARGRPDAAPYKALPPAALYLDSDAWEATLASRQAFQLAPFSVASTRRGLDGGGRRGQDFAAARAAPDGHLLDAVRDHLRALQDSGLAVLIAGYTNGSCERIRTLLADHGLLGVRSVETWTPPDGDSPGNIGLTVLPLERGFTAPDLAVITEQDIFGDRLVRPQRRRRKQADSFIGEVSSLSVGDLVVHADHGIGRYAGLESLVVSGAPHDCLKLVYADDDKLYLPVENIEVLSRFGSDQAPVALDRLGSASWQARKSKVKKRLKDMAEALLKVAASRSLKRVAPVTPPEGLYQEFAARFPFPETDDQLRAIDDVLDDLGREQAMDRLICGDVGFGKTEVALRAAFVMAASGRQVAVVVPTTLLARQHFRTVEQRFQGQPLQIAQLSRLVAPGPARAVRQGLADGTIDLVVGTHALLSAQVRFKDLGLLIVDEEQHFGVKQKERLKSLAEGVHVLTLSATPIPRTLQLSLAGVRDMSLIATPPIDRLAVRTFVLPYDPVVLREAIMREHFRGGQTFYVCPRIEDLEGVREQIAALVPEIKIAVAHGRLSAAALEDVMSAFYEGRFDVLLSTSIVESGLDIPTANTLIIHRADLFGLSQLYQLRGRVGRSKLRGYAYFTYAPNKALNPTALQRLEVIDTLDTLGAGFTLASHDLDIRGAGNLLGEEQSGHIREVGIELFQQMLEEAVAAARRGEFDPLPDTGWVPTINLGMPVLIPESYVADLGIRLELYRRAARLTETAELEAFAAELIDRFGPLPPEAENLLTLMGIKQLCRQAGVERLEAGPRGAVVQFRAEAAPAPARLVAFVTRQEGAAKLKPDGRLVLVRPWEDKAKRLQGVRRLLQVLGKLAA